MRPLAFYGGRDDVPSAAHVHDPRPTGREIMRFAYIDSQGKEVGIPTVEALQLRIELGAITEETMFYDASKDRWDPAGEHEIFRTLSREVKERGDEGPRPPRPKVPPSDEEAGDEDEGFEVVADDGSGEEASAESRPRAPDPFDREQDPMAETDRPEEGGWVEAEFDDVRESVDAPDQALADHGDDWDVDLGDFGALDLAPELEEADPEEADLEEADLEEADLEEADVARDESPPSFGDVGELELERPFAEQHGEGVAVDPESDMQMETPLAELEPGPTGEWDERGEPEAEADLPSPPAPTSPPSAAEAVRRERARKDPYDRRVQRPRGDAPRRRRSRPLARRRRGPSAGTVAAVVALAAVVGAGGWFGWSAVRGSEAGSAPEDSLPVLPPLPADLEAGMREVADSAWQEGLDTLRAMAARADLPDEPHPDWLGGIYLATAGDYPDVPVYWAALRDHLNRVRAVDEEVFLAALDRRLAASEIPAESRDTVAARARAGFRAAESGREVIYGRLEDLIEVAVDLHEFLVGNEANIAYEPAAGLSRDPVTEAVPATPELGDEMWDRVGEIPAALESLGTLDRVTTERILEVFHRRLASVGIR